MCWMYPMFSLEIIDIWFVLVKHVLRVQSEIPFRTLVTLFKNGQRMAPPQPLPESLQGKALYPAITYRNVCLHYNFGPEPLAALPFKCRMVQDAAKEDITLTPKSPAPKDGKYDVLFPVFL